MMAIPPQQPISFVHKVAIVERFDWIIVKFYLPRTVETSWVTVLLVFIPVDLEPCFVDIRSRSLSPVKLSSPAISVAGLVVNVIPLNKDASVSLLPLFSPCYRKPKWFMQRDLPRFKHMSATSDNIQKINKGYNKTTTWLKRPLNLNKTTAGYGISLYKK